MRQANPVPDPDPATNSATTVPINTLMPWATVFNNVYLPLKLAGISCHEARPRIVEALAMVGLEYFSDAYPRQLSLGMKMRVAIARVLIVRPTVLLRAFSVVMVIALEHRSSSCLDCKSPMDQLSA